MFMFSLLEAGSQRQWIKRDFSRTVCDGDLRASLVQARSYPVYLVNVINFRFEAVTGGFGRLHTFLSAFLSGTPMSVLHGTITRVQSRVPEDDLSVVSSRHQPRTRGRTGAL